MKGIPATPSELALLLCLAASIWPQSAPRFEVATIKPAPPDAVRNLVMPSGPDRLSIPSMTLVWLIYTAYGEGLSTAFKVTGGPEWVNKTAYAIEGKAPGPSTRRQLRMMLRTLLEERFALKIRNETRTGDVYALVLDRRDGTLGGDVPGGRDPVFGRGAVVFASIPSVARHHRAGSDRAQGPIQNASGLPIHPTASRRSGSAAGVRRALALPSTARPMGIEVGKGQRPAARACGRERGAADGELM